MTGQPVDPVCSMPLVVTLTVVVFSTVIVISGMITLRIIDRVTTRS